MAITFKNMDETPKPMKRGVLGKIPNDMRKIMNVRTGAIQSKGTPPTKTDVDAILNEAGLPPKPELIAGEVPEGQTRFRVTKEGLDYRRKQVLRLVLRGVPKQTISEHLGVSLKLVYEDMHAINADMRSELQNMDYVGYIGMSMAFFDECRTIALRLATDVNEKSNGTKMNALRTAMDAESKKQEFLTRVGLFKVVSPTDPFNAIQTGRHGSYSDENDMQSFMNLISKSVSGQVVDVESRDVGPG